MEKLKINLPAIITDRDGVIKCGKNDIPFVNETLQMLRQPVGKLFPEKFACLKLKIPFYILTNGG